MKFLTFIFIALAFSANAQDKALEKLSKKELLALLQTQQQTLNAQKKTIDSLNLSCQNLKTAQLDSMTLKNELIYELENQLFKIKNEPPKNIEVLDLYSFGYQPFKNNERQHSLFLEETRKAVEKARLRNIATMIGLLQSKKINIELKKQLFAGFLAAYQGYLDNLTMEQFSFSNADLDATLRNAVLQKTAKELDASNKENRWIMLLETIVP
jgi:hypothetical protein